MSIKGQGHIKIIQHFGFHIYVILSKNLNV
jgi:hypothetical protein